jgi:glycosyltransferase involved in cell wall biosynthesis
MDIIVLPSLWEGLPNVLLEAMAEARPVVASRIEGVDEVVVDGETGILFEPGDAQALSEALFKLIRDKKCAEEMGRAGRARVREKFSIDKTVSDTMEIYQNLLTEYMDGQDNISFGR